MRVKKHILRDDNDTPVTFVASPNTSGGLNGGRPKFLVIHYTAGRNASGAVKFFERSSSRVSAHLVIDHDGDITQMLPFDQVGWHAGRSRWRDIRGLNRHSVGIELANWGKLKKVADGSWRSWTGEAVPNDRVILAEHKNTPGSTHGWETFDDPQMEACLSAAKAIVKKYDMGPWDVVGHDDISPLRKVDPGPAFEMDSFKARLFGRSEDAWNDVLFQVNSASGLNMRTVGAADGRLIKNLRDGAVVHVIEKPSNWWLVAEVIDGNDDTTGFVHSNWLQPA